MGALYQPSVMQMEAASSAWGHSHWNIAAGKLSPVGLYFCLPFWVS